jgi:hypothetical protein
MNLPRKVHIILYDVVALGFILSDLRMHSPTYNLTRARTLIQTPVVNYYLESLV